MGLSTVELFNPVDGVQLYNNAPEAVIVTGPFPSQKVGLVGLTDTVGGVLPNCVIV